jgi:hypothetical protein
MNTPDGNFIEKTIPNLKNATIKLKIGDVEGEISVENFKTAIIPLSALILDFPLNTTLQSIEDVGGNESSLQISTSVTKATKTLVVGDASTASGTITLLGSLSGQAFYGRDYNGTGTPTIFTFYSNGGEFYLYRQIGGVGTNLMSFENVTGYGKFINGMLYNSLTTTEINAITSPSESLTVWNSTLKTLCFYNGTSWQKITTTAM